MATNERGARRISRRRSPKIETRDGCLPLFVDKEYDEGRVLRDREERASLRRGWRIVLAGWSRPGEIERSRAAARSCENRQRHLGTPGTVQ